MSNKIQQRDCLQKLPTFIKLMLETKIKNKIKCNRRGQINTNNNNELDEERLFESK